MELHNWPVRLMVLYLEKIPNTGGIWGQGTWGQGDMGVGGG